MGVWRPPNPGPIPRIRSPLITKAGEATCNPYNCSFKFPRAFDTADSAVSKALEALATAGSAVSKALEALATADSAVSKALEALATADSG